MCGNDFSRTKYEFAYMYSNRYNDFAKGSLRINKEISGHEFVRSHCSIEECFDGHNNYQSHVVFVVICNIFCHHGGTILDTCILYLSSRVLQQALPVRVVTASSRLPGESAIMRPQRCLSSPAFLRNRCVCGFYHRAMLLTCSSL